MAQISVKPNIHDWREPALKLLLESVEAGGYSVSKGMITEIFAALGEYGLCKDEALQCISRSSLPQSIRNLFISLLEIVEGIRQEQIPDRRPRIHTPEDVLLLFGSMIYRDQELLKVIFLDYQHRFLTTYDAALGKANRMWVEPRCIFQVALEWDARKMVILHNHPSGNLDPSEEDIRFTRKMTKGCELLGIKLFDHLILGPANPSNHKKYFSFVEKKLL